MVKDIPLKEDFYSTSCHMANEAWNAVHELLHKYKEYEDFRDYYDNGTGYYSGTSVDLTPYWKYSRPKLISALTLVQQSVEFRIKGKIAGISPFLLLSNPVRKAGKKNLRFADFNTVDAQDLIKLYNIFCDEEELIPNDFINWYEEMRSLRNKFMHTVDFQSDISPKIILTAILFSYEYLNRNEIKWISKRYSYRVENSTNGVDLKDSTSLCAKELLAVHKEFSATVELLTNEESIRYLNFDKNKTCFKCKKCRDDMLDDEFFDDGQLFTCIETVQIVAGTTEAKCMICDRFWEEEDLIYI
ncbi:hypothetical protein [Pantoea ananatis]|uniref:hypothetical protein n=1 Tax=Pantoea ananas TaxID=553 RepID=UPI003C187883